MLDAAYLIGPGRSARFRRGIAGAARVTLLLAALGVVSFTLLTFWYPGCADRLGARYREHREQAAVRAHSAAIQVGSNPGSLQRLEEWCRRLAEIGSRDRRMPLARQALIHRIQLSLASDDARSGVRWARDLQGLAMESDFPAIAAVAKALLASPEHGADGVALLERATARVPDSRDCVPALVAAMVRDSRLERAAEVLVAAARVPPECRWRVTWSEQALDHGWVQPIRAADTLSVTFDIPAAARSLELQSPSATTWVIQRAELDDGLRRHALMDSGASIGTGIRRLAGVWIADGGPCSRWTVECADTDVGREIGRTVTLSMVGFPGLPQWLGRMLVAPWVARFVDGLSTDDPLAMALVDAWTLALVTTPVSLIVDRQARAPERWGVNGDDLIGGWTVDGAEPLRLPAVPRGAPAQLRWRSVGHDSWLALPALPSGRFCLPVSARAASVEIELRVVLR